MIDAEIMLDSGAFTAKYQGVDINLREYIRFVHKHDGQFKGGVINLDVISVETDAREHRADAAERSYQNWSRMQKAGIETIPVYHLGTDEKYLERYVKEAEYICLGAIAKMDTPTRLKGLSYIWGKYLMDADGKALRKVHGLGLTNIEIMTRYPWFSVDSSTPIKTASYGSIYVPKNALRNEKPYDYSDIQLLRITTSGRKKIKSLYDPKCYPTRVKELAVEYCNSMGYELMSEAPPKDDTILRHMKVPKETVAVILQKLSAATNEFMTPREVAELVYPEIPPDILDQKEISLVRNRLEALAKKSSGYERKLVANRKYFRYNGPDLRHKFMQPREMHRWKMTDSTHPLALPIGIRAPSSDEESLCLNENWQQRMDLNLRVWNEVAKRTKTKLYTVVTSSIGLDKALATAKDSDIRARILVSYHILDTRNSLRRAILG